MTIEKIEKRICDRCGFTEVDPGGRGSCSPTLLQGKSDPRPSLGNAGL